MASGALSMEQKRPLLIKGDEQQAVFVAQMDKTLAVIMLAVELSLLYVIGANPMDPVVVWKAWLTSFSVRLGLIN